MTATACVVVHRAELHCRRPGSDTTVEHSDKEFKHLLPRIRGNVAYAAQHACILNATVRDNIIFGQLLDEERFQHAATVAALKEVCCDRQCGTPVSKPCASSPVCVSVCRTLRCCQRRT